MSQISFFYVCLYKKSSWELNRSQIFIKLRDSFSWCGIFHLWYHFSIKTCELSCFWSLDFLLALYIHGKPSLDFQDHQQDFDSRMWRAIVIPYLIYRLNMLQPLWILVIFPPEARSVGSVSYPWIGDEVHVQVSPSPLLLPLPIPGHDALRSSLLTLPGVAS